MQLLRSVAASTSTGLPGVYVDYQYIYPHSRSHVTRVPNDSEPLHTVHDITNVCDMSVRLKSAGSTMNSRIRSLCAMENYGFNSNSSSNLCPSGMSSSVYFSRRSCYSLI